MEPAVLLSSAHALLGTTSVRRLSLTALLPMDLLTRQPVPGRWSAAECLSQLVDTERSDFPNRVRVFVASQDFPDFDPDAQLPIERSRTGELAHAFAALR